MLLSYNVSVDGADEFADLRAHSNAIASCEGTAVFSRPANSSAPSNGVYGKSISLTFAGFGLVDNFVQNDSHASPCFFCCWY
ncbi:hypothetical protein Y032_0108g23 [Ancylostoma ceylanicum]|uniref:Uncharacterized protein n=1 Tax=Ancylostoma ceylanicum TaxID=53326 RepID=A0A016TF04_9BILA|nr:hypothetical protein Y032_0108g23 [Ancylostoma ceylanicum]